MMLVRLVFIGAILLMFVGVPVVGLVTWRLCARRRRLVQRALDKLNNVEPVYHSFSDYANN